jgi:AraC-like DNA-binding protein
MALGHDPLSSALANLDVRCTLEGPARLRAPWSISSNGKRCARFYVLLQGRCWLYATELRAPVRLAQGDLVFATADSEHRLCDRLLTTARDVSKTGSPGSGPATLLLRGEIHLPQERIGPLLSPLPRVVHLPGGGHSSSWLASAFGAVAASGNGDSGAQRTADLLTEILLAQVIRTHLEKRTEPGVPAIAVVADPSLGPILELMHSRPGEPWTVAGLARAGGLSRSLFAARFASALKMPPMRYLLECRMRVAAAGLRGDRTGMKEIARRAGYSSEAAFSSAFKKWSGRPPSAFRGEA